MNLSSLTPFVVGAVLIGGLAAVALLRERRRGENLRNWVAGWPGARLHWPVAPETRPPLSLETLAEKALGKPPLGWGSAVEIPAAGAALWLLECRTTRPGRKSADWVTLVARFQAGIVGADLSLSSLELREEMVSVSLIERELVGAGLVRGFNPPPPAAGP